MRGLRLRTMIATAPLRRLLAVSLKAVGFPSSALGSALPAARGSAIAASRVQHPSARARCSRGQSGRLLESATEGRTLRRDVTMLELVTVVNEHTRTEGEAVATITHMVNSGAVRLCGIFSGACIDLGEVDQPWRPAA